MQIRNHVAALANAEPIKNQKDSTFLPSAVNNT